MRAIEQACASADCETLHDGVMGRWEAWVSWCQGRAEGAAPLPLSEAQVEALDAVVDRFGRWLLTGGEELSAAGVERALQPYVMARFFVAAAPWVVRACEDALGGADKENGVVRDREQWLERLRRARRTVCRVRKLLATCEFFESLNI